MANYAQAALLTAQAKLATKYNEAEMRRKTRPAINLALQNQEYSIPNAGALKVAEQRPVEVHFLHRKQPGAVTVKATRHVGDKADSGKVTLVWARVVEKFNFSHKLAFNKVFGADTLFQNELEQAILNIQDRLETSALAYLVANRCQRTAAQLGTTYGTGTWSDVNFANVIAAGNKDYFLQNAKTFMWGRHYRGELDMIADLYEFPILERIKAQGAGNSTNLGFQFDNVNIVPTTETILAAYTAGSALVMPRGSFASLPWNDPLNRRGHGRENSYVGQVMTLPDPFGLNLEYDVSVYSDRADTAAIDGHVQDFNDEYEISAMVGFALPLLSTASDSVVHLIAQG